MLKHYIRQILPDDFVMRVKRTMAKQKQARLRNEVFTENDLLFVLKQICRVKKGDVLFVFSSMNGLAIDVSAWRVLELLFDLVGPNGTILMPSYPKSLSYTFLKSGQVWDVRRTPSYSGLLTEIFRRNKDTRRSLHPTKSVAAWGTLRDHIVSEHHTCVRPYSEKSPYFRFVENEGKAIGLGVSAQYMAFIHTIDDHFGDKFPVTVYRDEVLLGKAVDYSGRKVEIPTLAHDIRKMRYDTPRFLRTYFHENQANSLTYKSRDFFYADAKAVFEKGILLAKHGATIYTKDFRERIQLWLGIRSSRKRIPTKECLAE